MIPTKRPGADQFHPFSPRPVANPLPEVSMTTLAHADTQLGRFHVVPSADPEHPWLLLGPGFHETYRRKSSAVRHLRKLEADEARLDAVCDLALERRA